MKKVLLHLGYPKTATTSLQNNLFGELHAQGTINFLGRAARFLDREVSPRDVFYPAWRIIKPLIELDDEDFAGLLPGFRQTLETSLLVEDKLNVISEELLSESLVLGAYSRSAARNLDRLQLLFAGYDVRPVVVIRNQETAIYSMFVEWYPRHFARPGDGGDSFKRFLRREAGRTGESCLSMFDYQSYVQAVIQRFSSCNTIPYEMSLHQPRLYSEFWASLIGIGAALVEELLNRKRENVKLRDDEGYYARKSTASGYLSRTVNASPALLKLKNSIYYESGLLEAAWRRIARPVLDKISAKQALIPYPDPDDLVVIDSLFRRSNSLLDRQDRLDLAQYGYPLGISPD